MSNTAIRIAVRSVLSASLAALVAPTIMAAEVPIQEVVVTGSRISSPNMTSISPVTACR
jgi:iron complex outermembrane receptor protein